MQAGKSNQGLIIGIVVVVVLLCCCCLGIIGFLFFSGSSITNVIKTQLTAMPDIQSIATIEPSIEATSEPSSTESTGGTPSTDATAEPQNPSTIPGMPTISADVVPQGGLGDDIQRADAWARSLAVVIPSGCLTPVAKDTKIEVTQKPDSSGNWQEKWTIACGAGATSVVDITFKPSSSGVTDIQVTPSK